MILTDDKTAIMDLRELKCLSEYSCSIPTGKTIGKRWRRNMRWHDGPAAAPRWFMGEYEESIITGYVDIRWREVFVL